MEHIYVKKIKVNNLFHLHNFDIELGSEDTPHLILTGRNGSGKTVLLNAISDFLDKVKGSARSQPAHRLPLHWQALRKAPPIRHRSYCCLQW